MKIRVVIAFSGLIFLQACFGVPPRIWRSLNCYSGEYTGVDTLLRIDGYYSQMSVYNYEGAAKYIDGKKIILGIDTSYINFKFFNDGYFIAGFSKPDTTFKRVPNINLNSGSSSYQLTRCEGTYRVVGDTIKVQYIFNGGPTVKSSFETWFLIEDKTSLRCINWKEIGLAWGESTGGLEKSKDARVGYRATFIPLGDMYLPGEVSYLKSKKKFHCKSEGN